MPTKPQTLILDNSEILKFIATNDDLSLMETKLSILILSYRNPYTAKCFPSRRTLAKLLGVTHQRITAIIKSLTKKQVIVHIQTIKPTSTIPGSSQFFFVKDFKKIIKNKQNLCAIVYQDALCAALKIKPNSIAQRKPSQRANPTPKNTA